MGLQPRLHLDISWADIASIFAPVTRSRIDLNARIEAAWPAYAVPALSVRTAFDALLTSLGLPHGSAIAMSAVTIQSMADIVRAHGLALAPVDIELETLAPNPSKIEQTIEATGAKAYVHAHLFGSRNVLSKVADICSERGVLLVEDCAQGYAGAPPTVPQVADISLYSFGPIKAQTCLGGAVAVCRTQRTAGALRAILDRHSPMPDQWLRARALKYAALKLLSQPSAYALALAGLRASGLDPDQTIGGAARGFSGGDLMTALRRTPPRTLLRLMARRTGRPARAAWRTTAGAILDANLGSVFERPGSAAPIQAFWLYPVLVEDPVAAMAVMRRAGFDATRGATSLRAITEATNAEAPESSVLINHVLYLPIAPSMSPNRLKRMSRALLEGVRPFHRVQEKVAA